MFYLCFFIFLCVIRHKAIADYLQNCGFHATLEAFKQEADVVSILKSPFCIMFSVSLITVVFIGELLLFFREVGVLKEKGAH